MRTFVLFSHLPFLAAATCGGGGGGGPTPPPDAAVDAPVADAPPVDAPPPANPGGLEQIDWRHTRGAPIASHAVTIPGAGGDLFAVSHDGFVTQAGCDDPRGCSLTWRDPAGAAGAQIAHSTRATITSVSPDGKRAALIATEAIETCNTNQSAFQVVRGTLKLLDLATGTSSFDLALRSNTWSVQGFTSFGDFFFAAPIKGTACLADTLGWLAASTPFQAPPGLAATDTFIQAVDPQRWIIQRNTGALGTVDPKTANSFVPFGDKSPSSFDVTQGWTHTYTGFADLAQDVVSTSPTGVKHATSLHDNDWHASGARGRWFRVCGQPQVEGFRTCRAIDGQGELATVEFRVTLAGDHPDDAVLLASAVVFTGPLDDGSRAIQRIALATGKRDVLHTGNGTLQPLGDGAGAILLLDGAAWYIEGAHEERIAEHVSQVIAAPQLPFLRRPPARHDDVALVVATSDAGNHTLAVLDARTRRLARVTDDVFVNQPAGAPFSFANTCGQPWTAHNAGANHIEGLLQTAQQLFFVERGATTTMWMLPIDLSAPPRKLGELAGDPAACHAPLISPDGHRLGFAESTADGTATRVVISN